MCIIKNILWIFVKNMLKFYIDFTLSCYGEKCLRKIDHKPYIINQENQNYVHIDYRAAKWLGTVPLWNEIHERQSAAGSRGKT